MFSPQSTKLSTVSLPLKVAGAEVSSRSTSSAWVRHYKKVAVAFLFLCAVLPMQSAFAVTNVEITGLVSSGAGNDTIAGTQIGDFITSHGGTSANYSTAVLCYGDLYPNNTCQIVNNYGTNQPYSNFNDYVMVNSGYGDGDYWFGAVDQTTGNTFWFPYTVVGSDYYLYESSSTLATHFISFTPSGIVGTSTSATTSVSFYISPSDYATSSDTVTISWLPSNTAFCNLTPNVIDVISLPWINGGQSPCAGSDIAGTGFSKTFPVLQSGLNIISGTTALLGTGTYDVTLSIQSSSFFGILSQSLSASTTSFIVSTSSAFDTVQASVRQSIADLAASTSPTAFLSSCNPLGGFNITTCLVGLIVPSTADLNNAYYNSFGQILNNTPFSLINLTIGIFASSTPTEPPALTYTFGSSSPAVLQGLTYSVNIFDPQYIGSSSPLDEIEADDGTNKNIWQIVDPYFTDVVAIAVFLAIISDILGLEVQHDRTQETTTTTTPEIRSGGKQTGIVHYTSTKSGYKNRTYFGRRKK